MSRCEEPGHISRTYPDGYNRCATCHRAASIRCKGRHMRMLFPGRPVFEAVVARGSQMEMARRYAARYGSTPQAAIRALQHMRTERSCRAETADAWLVLVGLHPVQVYGDEW